MFEVISMHHLNPDYRHLIAYDIIDIAANNVERRPDRRKMYPVINGIYVGGVDYVNELIPKDRESAHKSWLGVEIDTTQKIPRPHGFVTVKPLIITAFGQGKKTVPQVIEGVSIDVVTKFSEDVEAYLRLYSQGLIVAQKLHPRSTVIATEPMDKFIITDLDIQLPEDLTTALQAASTVLSDVISIGPIHRSDMSMFRKSVFGAVLSTY